MRLFFSRKAELVKVCYRQNSALCHIKPLNYALEISEINGICDVMEKYIREQDVYEYNREK